jgi:hypothetical protein
MAAAKPLEISGAQESDAIEYSKNVKARRPNGERAMIPCGDLITLVASSATPFFATNGAAKSEAEIRSIGKAILRESAVSVGVASRIIIANLVGRGECVLLIGVSSSWLLTVH